MALIRLLSVDKKSILQKLAMESGKLLRKKLLLLLQHSTFKLWKPILKAIH